MLSAGDKVNIDRNIKPLLQKLQIKY